MSDSDPFHEKYRPRNLDQIIGHEKSVSRMRGIKKSGKYPKAIIITGPTSAGKTTLARCFAAEVNGKAKGHPDYEEQNAGLMGGKDDMKNLLDIAMLLPQRGDRRFIVIDEAQKLTSAAQSAILKPLEEGPGKTTFILCSMEPEKIVQAIKNRCSTFMLSSHTKENVVRYLKRIAKKEEMDYASEKILTKIANNSQGEMRTAANIIEALSQFAADGNEKLTAEDVDEVITSTTSKDDALAVVILCAVYGRKFSVVQKALLETSEPFALINKLIWLNGYMLSTIALQGERHDKVWITKYNQELRNRVNDLVEKKAIESNKLLHTFATTQIHLVRMRMQASSFLVPEMNLIGSILYELIMELKK